MKKLILITLLLIGNYSFSQEKENCNEKYPYEGTGSRAWPDGWDPCEDSDAYAQCLCRNSKIKFKQKIAKSKDKKIEEDDSNKKNAETYFLLMNQYDSMLSRAQNMDSNSDEYKEFIKQMRITEQALNIPRHQYYDNPGFINENTTNSELNKTYRQINDTKESIDNFTSTLTNAVGSLISARADRIGLEDREENIQYSKKREIEKQKTYYKHLQLEYREKMLVNLMEQFDEKNKSLYDNCSTEKKNEIVKSAFKFIEYNNCPNPRCENGVQKAMSLDKIRCNQCDGKKSIHNHGNGGGYLNGAKNFMSCTKCLGTGTISEINYNKNECPVCNGSDKILKYTGEKNLPYQLITNIYNEKTSYYNNAMNYFKNNPDKKSYSYYKKEDTNQSNLIFVDKDFESYKPSFEEISESKNKSIGTILDTKYGYDGKIVEQLSLKDGIRSIRNYDNGKVKQVRHFDKEGFPIGEHTYDWGNTKTIEIYDKNFLLRFNASTYIKKGNSELSTLHQRPIIRKEIYKNGNLKSLTNNKEGTVKLYHENGNKKHFYSKENINGTRYGEHKIFHENGEVAEIGRYNGMSYDDKTGDFKSFYSNGSLESKGKYYNKKYSNGKGGKWLYYYENGNLKAEEYYSNSRPNVKSGKWKTYHENGVLKSEEKYKGDHRSSRNKKGTWKYYDENGIVIKEVKH